MLENNFSEDKIAWYIFLNGRAGNWHKCKEIAREMREDYENTRKETEDASKTEPTN
tara:strand:+ start:4464 stop:4631 length:168 start_codon:yes stop_codon:yes gene_type:complete